MTRLLLAAVFVILLAGCSKVTPDNYALLESGMTRDEVHAVLGEPDEVSGGGIGRMTLMTERWSGRKHVISVTFASDKLTLKSIEASQDE
jgi:hypothetical protein